MAKDESDYAAAHPLSNPSFVGYIATQFLGAFNDNLFKQLMLLLAIPTVGQAVNEAGNVAGGGGGGGDMQGIATIVFGIPFVIFGGLAGYLADRYSKRRVIVLSKVAEIVVMVLGLFAFLAAPAIGFSGLWVVMFLMGTQSAFFGPGKYGILPEMMRPDQLSRANGIVLMTTFIAIIFGTSLAGPIKDWVGNGNLNQLAAARELWIASIICILVAVVGTLVSLLIHPVAAAAPGLGFRAEYLVVPKPMRGLLRRDRPLLLALAASCVFWLIAGLTIQAVNSLCKTQLGLSDTMTSLMVALISIGIAVGGVTAGWLSRSAGGSADQRVIHWGMWGVVVCCALLAITIPGMGLLVGVWGLPVVLILLGGAAAFFSIPIQVFLQARPPAALKGRMIAVMNQANFFAIVLSGAVYIALDLLVTAQAWPRSAIFGAMAMMFLPVAIFFKLDSTSLPPAGPPGESASGESVSDEPTSGGGPYVAPVAGA
jgi:acyl-[acyl-carrier-protein]-phospholipid O-acyltransferase/long-chain-fatty-acid--[acyl-carrier-protein] ligase